MATLKHGIPDPRLNPTPGAAPRRGRPPRSFEAHGQTREALVRAGMEVFTAQGFSLTGVDVVLRRLGVPKGSFYHYFSSKEAFGREVLSAYDAYILRKLERWLSPADRSALDCLLDFIADAKRGIARHQYERGCLVGNLGMEVSALPEGFREALNQVLLGWQARVAQCLKQGQQRGELPAGLNCKELAAFFWTGWEGAVLRARLERSPRPLDIFARSFVQLLRR